LRRTLIRASLSISDEYDYVRQSVQTAFASVARERAGAIIFDRTAWRALHPAVQRGTLRAAVHRLAGDLRDLDWTPVEDARLIALSKNAGSVATLPNGLRLTVGYADFEIAAAGHLATTGDLPLLNVECVDLPPEGLTPLPGTTWTVQTQIRHRREETASVLGSRWSATFDWNKCKGTACLRRRRAGDRFQPTGLSGHTQTLHDYMINAKIERAVRTRLPLLVVGDQVTWVCGWRIDERARVDGDTSVLWDVSFQNKETD
jgi:tRNA(Ile)-lysidine synthase